MAKKFAFRLARVQKLRERVRDQKQLAHAQAVDYQHRVEGQIEQIRAFHEEQLDRLATEVQSGQFSVERALQHRNFGSVLTGLQGQLHRQLEQVKHVVAARHADLVNAERDLRVLEKLGDRARQRYQEAQDRAEQTFLDELAVLGAIRARVEQNG